MYVCDITFFFSPNILNSAFLTVFSQVFDPLRQQKFNFFLSSNKQKRVEKQDFWYCRLNIANFVQVMLDTGFEV